MIKFKKILIMLTILGISQLIFLGFAKTSVLIVRYSSGSNSAIVPMKGGCQKVINNCTYPLFIPLYPSGAAKSFFLNPPSCIVLTECTQLTKCEGTIPANAMWNTSDYHEKTWNGHGWSPTKTANYNTIASPNDCKFTCKPNYTWNTSTEICEANVGTYPCAAKPANTVWNTVSSYTQTWNGTEWFPLSTTTTYNTTASTTSCRYRCATNYTWNGSSCAPDTRTYTCSTKPSIGTLWNTVSSYTQTWNGTSWSPINSTTAYNTTASTTACRYACATNYTWNGSSCVAETRTYTCTAKPVNTVWNTVNNYNQTWNGTSWSPADSTTAYNATSSTTACRYACAINYTWNGSSCIVDTPTYTCAAKPANTAWNTVSSYAQTWNGIAWSPASSTTTYNTTASTTSCRYICATNYTWNGSSCIADTRTATCGGTLPTNTIWNTSNNYTQTWNGTARAPTKTANYNTTSSTDDCRYACATNYTWNGSSCAPDTRTYTCATKATVGTIWNTVSSYTQTWNGTTWLPADSTTAYNATSSTTSCRYACAINYTWNGSSCIANTQTYTCAAKPANTVWNTVSSYAQTWNGIAWSPASSTTTYNTTASTTSCRYSCATNYTWNGNSCVANTQTYTCAARPANTVWNTVSGYTQTWNGTSWSPANSTTAYNATSSTTSCRYACAINHTWNGSSCVANTQTGSCTGKPLNSVWNTASTITQTWNASFSAWLPSAVATYGTTASTTECRYKCDTNYMWNGTSCIPSGCTTNGDCSTGQICSGYIPSASSCHGSYESTSFLCAGKPIPYSAYVCMKSGEPYQLVPADGCPSGRSLGFIQGGSIIPSSETLCQFINQPEFELPNCEYKCNTYTTLSTCNANSSYCDWASRNNVLSCSSFNQTTCQSTNGCDWDSGLPTTLGTCVLAQTHTCAAKPSIGTLWNTVSSYTQTWNGTVWSPAATSTAYNTTASTTACRYKCATGYTWNGTSCAVVNTCLQGFYYTEGVACNQTPTSCYTDGGPGCCCPIDIKPIDPDPDPTSCQSCPGDYPNGGVCIADCGSSSTCLFVGPADHCCCYKNTGGGGLGGL